MPDTNNDVKYVQPVQVVEVQSKPQDVTDLAWKMVDKVGQGGTAIVFAFILLWYFSRKTVSKVVDNFNDLLSTLKTTVREQADSQKELTATQKHLNETLQGMTTVDGNTLSAIGKVDSKLKLIRSLLLEMRSSQMGINPNRLPPIEVIEAETEEDSQ